MRAAFVGLVGLLLAAGAVAPCDARTRHASPGQVAHPAPITDETACGSAIAAAARSHAVPPRVLGAIAVVESGRPIGQRLVPWPWAINAEGVGHFYASKAEAIAAVQTLRAAGMRSIDVGCMQINLAAHPQAFDSLDDAFDPVANARYAARFLRILTAQTGRLADAMTAYHSHTPEFAADYARRLLAIWPGAAELGLNPDPAPPPAVPSLLTETFQRQLARDHAALHRADLPAATGRRPGLQLAAASQRGAAWPSR